MMKKKIELKKIMKLIDINKQEIQELKEKLNDKNDTSENKEEEIYDDDDITYLETEEEAVERIANFHEKKGKEYIDLPILLSKLNVNSSKELISNVKQLVKNLYDKKQISKQV